MTARVAAGVPAGGQFAATGQSRAPVRLADRHAQLREEAQQLLERIAFLPGISGARVTDNGYVRARVRLDRIAALHEDMSETLGSGRESETPEAPLLLRVEETDSLDGFTRFELSDGHHRAAHALRAGDCWVEAEIDPRPDEEPLEGPFYDFIPTREASAEEFCARFGTDLYTGDWDSMLDSELLQAGGDMGVDIGHLADSLVRDGMQEPVDIEDGRVTDGCHRVTLAKDLGVPIRYREWTR